MKSLIATGFVAASLAFSASTPMAANTPVHHATKAAPVTHARAPARVAAHKYQTRAQLSVDVGQFIQSMLAGRMPNYANLIRAAARAPASHGYAGSSYSPSYDYSAGTAASCAACDSQAAADQENQAIQQMNDTNALTASMAAAEAQNDAANAATLQTEINAGM